MTQLLLPEDEATVPDGAGIPVSNASVVLDGVTVVRRSTKVLQGLDCEFHQGLTVVLGANGAGKSTMLNAMVGLVPVASGSVTIAGHDMSTRRGRRDALTQTSLLAQSASFPSEFTVREMLEYSAWIGGLRRSETADALEIVKARLDLSDFWQQRLGELSGGTRQRAFLAQSMLRDPQVLLLDEPTSAIDSIHRGQFRELLCDLATDRTIILTSHLVEDVTILAERVLVLVDGRAAFRGTPDELAAIGSEESTSNPLEHPVERALRILNRIES